MKAICFSTLPALSSPASIASLSASSNVAASNRNASARARPLTTSLEHLGVILVGRGPHPSPARQNLRIACPVDPERHLYSVPLRRLRGCFQPTGSA